MRAAQRLGQLIMAWGTVGLCYGLGAVFGGEAKVLTASWADQAMAFRPEAMLLYLSFFVLIPYAFGCVRADVIRPLRRSMQYAAVGALAVYVLWPSSMAYPQVVGAGWAVQLWRWLHQWDTAGNCLPSLHVVLALLCGLALARSHQGARRGLEWLWVALVIVSVLLVKRHLWIDVGAGVMLAVVAAKGGGLWGRRHLI